MTWLSFAALCSTSIILLHETAVSIKVSRFAGVIFILSMLVEATHNLFPCTDGEFCSLLSNVSNLHGIENVRNTYIVFEEDYENRWKDLVTLIFRQKVQ